MNVDNVGRTDGQAEHHTDQQCGACHGAGGIGTEGWSWQCYQVILADNDCAVFPRVLIREHDILLTSRRQPCCHKYFIRLIRKQKFLPNNYTLLTLTML